VRFMEGQLHVRFSGVVRVAIVDSVLQWTGHTTQGRPEPYGDLGFRVGRYCFTCSTFDQLMAWSDALGALDTEPAPLSDWMSTLPNAVRDRCFTRMTFPATHDSAAYTTDFSHPINAWWSHVLRPAPHLRRFLSDWVCCQSKTIFQQLKLGVRCFDLRIARSSSGILWLVHNISLVPLHWTLLEIRRFLLHHKGELVVLRFKPGWEQRATMNDAAILQLSAELERVLGATVIAGPSLEGGWMLSLSNLIASGRQCIVLWESSEVPAGSCLWTANATTVISHWANTSEIAVLRDKCANRTANGGEGKRDGCALLECSFTLTPNGQDIRRSLGRFYTFRARDSLRTLASHANAALLEMINANPAVYAQLYSIISCDHPTHEVIAAIVALNV
jgi:hypothetical protein